MPPPPRCRFRMTSRANRSCCSRCSSFPWAVCWLAAEVTNGGVRVEICCWRHVCKISCKGVAAWGATNFIERRRIASVHRRRTGGWPIASGPELPVGAIWTKVGKVRIAAAQIRRDRRSAANGCDASKAVIEIENLCRSAASDCAEPAVSIQIFRGERSLRSRN